MIEDGKLKNLFSKNRNNKLYYNVIKQREKEDKISLEETLVNDDLKHVFFNIQTENDNSKYLDDTDYKAKKSFMYTSYNTSFKMSQALKTRRRNSQSISGVTKYANMLSLLQDKSETNPKTIDKFKKENKKIETAKQNLIFDIIDGIDIDYGKTTSNKSKNIKTRILSKDKGTTTNNNSKEKLDDIHIYNKDIIVEPKIKERYNLN